MPRDEALSLVELAERLEQVAATAYCAAGATKQGEHLIRSRGEPARQVEDVKDAHPARAIVSRQVLAT